MIKSWFTVVKEDENGELFIELPDDLLNEMKWNESTALWWKIDTISGNVILSEENPEDETR